MIDAKLIVVGGDVKTPEVKLKLPTTIGRGREASLTLPHALVSRLHCEIFERDGQLFVRDLGSLNGTFINNLRIDKEQPLLPDELLTLGTITFRASYLAPQSAHMPTDSDQSAATANYPIPAEGLCSQPHLSVSAPAMAAATATTAMPEITANGQHLTAPPAIAAALITPTATITNHPTAGTPQPSAKPDIATNSDIFAGLLNDPTPDQSISLSALGNLPAANPQVSFVGKLPGIDDMPARTLDIDLEEISIAPDSNAKTGQDAVDESELGDFFRNIPK